MEKSIRKYWPVFVLPTMAAFTIGFIWPFIWGLYLSLCKFQTLKKVTFIGLSNLLDAECRDNTLIFSDQYRVPMKTLREGASPRHVPAMIFPVDDIPFTMNGKKVESAVTNIMNGRDVTNRSALSNPDALDIYIGIRDDLLEKGI